MLNKIEKKGVFDPEGKNKNPFTNKAYTENYFDIVKKSKWDKLKVRENAKEFFHLLEKNRVVIVEAGTGTGKTVIIPKLCMHYLDYKGKVLVTIPRTSLVESAAKWQRTTYDLPEDNKDIGYLFRGSDEFEFSADEKTKLTFATDGSAINLINKDKNVENFDIVIIDEVHERNVNIDTILLMLKRALYENPKLKVLVMSASLPKNLFENYFNDFDYGNFIVKAESNCGVDVYYEYKLNKAPVRELSVETFAFFKKIIKRKDVKNKKKFLIFMPTKKGAEQVGELIKKDFPKFKIYVINRDTAPIYEDDVDVVPEDGEKMIIISTPVWESSKTIKYLDVVIDNGYENSVTYNPKSMATEIKTILVSKGQIKQRIGRVGRNSRGTYFPMYSETTLENMLDDPIPPILTEDILSNIYNLNNLVDDEDYRSLVDVINELIQPPTLENQKIYLEMLYYLDFYNIYSEYGKMTIEGEIAKNNIAGDNFQLRASILKSVMYSCSREMSYIIAIINNSILMKEKLFDLEEDEEVDLLSDHKYGELFTTYRIVKLYDEYSINLDDRLEGIIKKYKINLYNMERIIRDAHKIFSNTKRYRYLLEKKDVNLGTDERVLLCLCLGYFNNLGIKKLVGKKYEYVNLYPEKSSKIVLRNKLLMSGVDYDKILYIDLVNVNNKTSVSYMINIPEKVIKYFPFKVKEIFY